MMIKRLVSVLCVLSLLSLPLAAAAAPVRDVRGDVPEDESLWGFLSIVMSAAMLKDLPSLAEGEAPSQGLTEAVMAVFEYNMFGLDRAVLTASDCAGLYDGFFASGTFTMPEKGDCPCVTVSDGKMIMDLAELNETPLVGAHVYEGEMRDGRLYMKADLYTAWGYYMTAPLDIPEEDLTWYAGAEICAEINEGEMFGWRLVSYRMTDVWQDGALSEWTNWEDGEHGYSFMLPSCLGPSGGGDGTAEWQSADGTVSVTMRLLPAMTFDEGMELLSAQEGRIDGQEEFSCILRTGTGSSQLLICGGGLSDAYLVTLAYPEERTEEFTFYAEIIRNSLTVRGLANG